ncbi:hypothetical protein ABEB36_012418 [Hypothenemus hampei]|uniref:MANSC domain-containing protein n=1 Tax=Hypothenemus hampei TaxID=57062 RepID=A0ABD1EBW5_HYPHA
MYRHVQLSTTIVIFLCGIWILRNHYAFAKEFPVYTENIKKSHGNFRKFSDGFIHRNPLLRVKRTEIDLQMCLDHFNVHKDKIIRTQDSQNMGAKYLSETDLGNREECLRLCCETNNCDVFVFEEKNSGSCYLFHCGPPEDFKCKFTHHVNYSSGVLSISRNLPDLESEIQLTKHVKDLTKLRKPELETNDVLHRVPMTGDVFKPIVSSTPSVVITKEVIPADKQPEARKCSRNQFECRSNGECIAIYNACDGIPQCADSSDEAPELGCPALEAVASISVQTTPAPALNKIPKLSVLQYGREGELVQQQSKQQQFQAPPQNYQPIFHNQPPSEGDFLRPVSDPIRSPVRNQFEPAMPNYLGLANGWGLSRQPLGNQPQVPAYQDGDTQHFLHKEKPYRTEGTNSQIQYPEYPNRMVNYYGDGYNRQPVRQDNWPMEESRYPQQPIYHSQENIAPMLPAKTEGTSRTVEPIIPKQTDTELLAHDLKHSKDNMEHDTIQKVKVKFDNSNAEPYKMPEDTQDGTSKIPRGAILSLTLGLIITGIMAILIGCRLRGVRRRLRKGGKGYAHDADYLVNGMYL